jgi:hypothetical protein
LPSLWWYAPWDSKQTPVKIGVTVGPPRQRLAAYQGSNWREVEYLHRRPVSIERMLVEEFLVHRVLDPWWRTGEWYEVRPVAEQLGGWKQLLDAAVANDVPGGDRFELTSADGEHCLAGMKRIERTFEMSCSCGHTYLHAGRLPKAVEQFAINHLGIGWQRPRVSPDESPCVPRGRLATAADRQLANERDRPRRHPHPTSAASFAGTASSPSIGVGG